MVDALGGDRALSVASSPTAAGRPFRHAADPPGGQRRAGRRSSTAASPSSGEWNAGRSQIALRHRLLRRTGSRRAAFPGEPRAARHRPGRPTTLQALNIPLGPASASSGSTCSASGTSSPEARRPLRPGERRRLPARGGGATRRRAAPSRDRGQARAADADGAAQPSRRSTSSPSGACRERGAPRSHPAPRQGARLSPAGAIRVLTGSYNGPEIDASAIDWRQQMPSSASARIPARRTRSAWCASTCPMSMASTCTTRR